ncbi:hypothetical protein BX600DRAFT_515943 [Xylariales sp. PMI_506]|nr:hypothetical protein BX600DRAFT_515943 [Xylariales sp. PMI_506]
MADQCIVCLENLDAEPTAVLPAQSPLPHSGSDSMDLQPSKEPAVTRAVPPQTPPTADDSANTSTTNGDDTKIAEIEVCGHVLHDACLREWTGKANSCPICRQAFHLVNVYDRVGGTKLSSYAVQDKKQVAEFDAQAWLDENPEDSEPSRPCVICRGSEREDLTLLCDSCDAPYHTYCVGLDTVPRGHWLCMECTHDIASLLSDLGEELGDADGEEDGWFGASEQRSDYLPRTQATMRRARRRARSDEWSGAWGQITGHVFDMLDIDLDNHDDDEALQNYRRSQRRRERERQEYQRWQQRLNIASRLGAGDTFASHLPRGIPQPAQRQQPPPPPQETVEEKQAWGALEKAMEASNPSGAAAASSSRKRKSRSATASPREPAPQPERRLKRPRTRRVPQSSTATLQLSTPQNGESSTAQSVQASAGGAGGVAPSFLSSLLKEVELSTPSDDENVRNFFGSLSRPAADASSPAASPSPSGHSSPRALSTTPPPRGINERSGSPLTLSSHIEPVYPPANFSPSRNGSDGSGSDSDSRTRQSRHRGRPGPHTPEIRHPRPRRQQPVNLGRSQAVPHSPESSPTRALSLKTKESINAIITEALKPHYKSGSINADQYTAINRDLSRKLYTEVTDEALSDNTRRHCEKIAAKEVARAISDLK